MRLPPHLGARQDAAGNYVDCQRIIANKQRHGVRRDGVEHPRNHLRGPGARLSGSVEEYKAGQRHHYDPAAPSVRFSQGVVMSASDAALAHPARRRSAGACRAIDLNTQLLKPVPAARCTKVDTAIPQGDGIVKGGKRRTDPFGGGTLQCTSLGQHRGSESRYKRSASLTCNRRECDANARPKPRGTVSEDFVKAHPEPSRFRTNEERYATTDRPSKRPLRSVSAAEATLPPWLK